MPISTEKQRVLDLLMIRLDVREADIEEKFVRSQGAGGQKVNKTSTCVMLQHVPTGIRVKCQETRSQALTVFLGAVCSSRRSKASKASGIS